MPPHMMTTGMFRETVLVLLAVAAASAVPAAYGQVTISTAQTQNMTCSGGVCAPTATTAVLNASDLENYITQEGNVTVTTTGTGVQAGTIDIDTALSWSQESVTLDAQNAIAVNAPVSVGQVTSELQIDIAAGNKGVLSFGPKGHIKFASLSDIFGINGGIFTLEKSVKSLAAAVTANPSGAYALANSYDASKDGAYTNSPIATTLNGTIEGLGNTISHLSINPKPVHFQIRAAFIEDVGTTGVIENLRLTRIRYQTHLHAVSRDSVGGLASSNSGYLFGDEVQGLISTPRLGYAGGLVDANAGTIVASSADVRVEAYKYAGGLAGYNDGLISLSRASGAVSGSDSAGELAGGLVAENLNAIDQSFSTGPVTGRVAGGLAGGNDGFAYPAPSITNSYATGNVTGAGFVDVLDTSVGGDIEYSYSTGTVGSGDGGFLCGSDDIATTFADDYWDTTTSGTDYGACGDSNVSGVTGLTTQQLQSGLPTGFDPSIWAEDSKINNGLPYLINNPPVTNQGQFPAR